MGLSYTQDYGLDFLILRFATIYGPGKMVRHGSIAIHSQMIEHAMLGQHTTIQNGGDEKDDMIYVKDVAHAIVLASFATNLTSRIFNIGSGIGYTLVDLANAIKKTIPSATFDIGPGLDYMNMSNVYCVMDTTCAKEELKFSPRFILEDGVRDYVETIGQLKLL